MLLYCKFRLQVRAAEKVCFMYVRESLNPSTTVRTWLQQKGSNRILEHVKPVIIAYAKSKTQNSYAVTVISPNNKVFVVTTGSSIAN